MARPSTDPLAQGTPSDPPGGTGPARPAGAQASAGPAEGADGPTAGAGRPPEPAGLARRFGALLIDWILCLLISGLFATPQRDGWAPVFVLIVEYGFFLGLFTQTPGMRLTRVRCVDARGGRPIGIPRALLRGFLLALLVPALIMDSARRGLHDRAAGSIVIDATAPPA